MRSAAGASLFGAIVLNVVAMVLLWRWWDARPTLAAQQPAPTPTAAVVSALPPLYTPQPVPTPTPAPQPTPTLAPTPDVADTRPRIGIIAGHWQNDSGAVCDDDGLQEVQITVAVAERVQMLLERQGYHVDLLAEFDPALTNYAGAALVSLHADSCLNWEGLTGFKVARSAMSAIPEIEDRLVACLYEEYGRASRLPRHDASITPNMTDYHAFRQIATDTPAAIIELGFLYKDRDTLTRRQARLADGVANGILCFLKTEADATR